MTTQFISPVGRLVQGSMTLHPKTDMKGKPVLNNDGSPVEECFLALAIAKTDPNLAAFYALFDAEARASFPHLYPNGGNCVNPKFAMKVQDGDGVDSNGQSVAGKEGFAGHYIFKMSSRYPPRCFHYGKYDPSQQIQNPDEIIKKGYFIRVSGTLNGNGVKPTEREAVPGLYVSANLVELVQMGQEIVSGPDAGAVFGAAPIDMSKLPAGASATPILPGGGGGLPGLPGTAPTLPGAAPAGLPPAPGAGIGLPPAGPVYEMQASAQGATREFLHTQGWTDEQLVQHGYLIIR
jgi:hypothetical protein